MTLPPEGEGPDTAQEGRRGAGRPVPDDEAGAVGIFPNWRWLYVVVVVYGVLVIGALTVLSTILSFGTAP